MFKSLIQPLQLFIKGATGKDRHYNYKLQQKLTQLQVACDGLQTECTSLQQSYSSLKAKHGQLEARHSQLKIRYDELKKESNTLISIADSEAKEWLRENNELRSLLEELEAENNTLAGRVIVLEHKLDLEKFSGDKSSGDKSSENKFSRSAAADYEDSEELEPEIALIGNELVDLSNISLALVGGHETTHRKVKEELEKYGLKRCVHVPPHSRESNSRDQVKDKISNCDLVVTITSYLNHSLSESVKKLKANELLSGDVIWLHTHGKSSVVRTVLNYFSDYSPVA